MAVIQEAHDEKNENNPSTSSESITDKRMSTKMNWMANFSDLGT
jgi:hypothetical protein